MSAELNQLWQTLIEDRQSREKELAEERQRRDEELKRREEELKEERMKREEARERERQMREQYELIRELMETGVWGREAEAKVSKLTDKDDIQARLLRGWWSGTKGEMEF
jgi:predicted transcriptional regulator YheO